ncbi:type II toxin-antitoxin system RelE/ParE family toxin [Galbitalea soli]|uniref:Type II toxin-antitoxin system RelE/ParE family toxin n=1 Tax=Galbitalea soli TaxID=1268042 RepID=A0A7C9TQJ1_9MICO|nr:type II toxin-antitoxin system RelE/ParE family toxin [Galbitalea soli]NYJ31460.1 mRNA-degrading endonuclease RelE of RelBE toxin-antitoxin system [Galbitalea soli]
MSWDVQLAPSAIRGLEKLPPRVAVAVVEFVTATLPTNPAPMSKPLRGELDGLWTARRGDYRVLFSLDKATNTLFVMRIAHRADVYGAQ